MKLIEKLLLKAEKDKDILAVIIYGSYARKEKFKDIDLCLVLFPRTKINAFEKQLEYSEFQNIDASIFQTLPLFIQNRVLKEGIVKHCKNNSLLYDTYIKSIKEFELFEPKYKLCLEGIANG